LDDEAAARSAKLDAAQAALNAELANAAWDDEQLRRAREFHGVAWVTVRRKSDADGTILAATISEAVSLPLARILVLAPDTVLEVPVPKARDEKARAGTLPYLGASSRATGNAHVENAPKDASSIPLRRTRATRRGRRRKKELSDAEAEEVELPSPSLIGSATAAAAASDAPAIQLSKPAAVEDSEGAVIGDATAVAAASDAQALQLSKPAVVEDSEAGVRPATMTDASLQCLALDFLEEHARNDDPQRGLGAALRFASMVAEGHPLMQPLDIVRVEIARGSSSVPASAWEPGSSRPIERRIRDVGNRKMMVTAHLRSDPTYLLKFAAVDSDSGREFTLYLDEYDIQALVPAGTAASPLEMIEAVAPRLRVADKGGHNILVAIQEAEAPPTFVSQANQLAEEAKKMCLEERLKKRSSEQKQEIVPFSESEPESQWTLVREEVMLFGDRIVLLNVERSNIDASVRLMLQEAGTCQPFIIELPRQGLYRQQRIYTQLCALSTTTLFVMAEEVVLPALLVVRIAETGVTLGAQHARGNTTLLCFSIDTWAVVDSAMLEGQHADRRSQILQFLMAMPDSAQATIAGLGAAKLALQGSVCGGPTCEHSRARLAHEAGLVCYADTQSTADATAVGSSWRRIAQRGQKMHFAGEQHLHVVRIFHRIDPYSQFMVSVFQVGTSQEWQLTLSAEDAQDYIPAAVVSTRKADWYTAAAEGLFHCCAFRKIGGKDVLTLQHSAGSPLSVQLVDFAPEEPPVSPRVVISGELASALAPLRTHTEAAPRVGTPLIRTCYELCGSGRPKHGAAHLTGGRFLGSQRNEWRDAPDRLLLHSTVRRICGLDLVLTLERLPQDFGHALVVRHPASCLAFEAALVTRDGACPEKLCVEQFSIAGVPLSLVFAEAASPYALHVLICSPRMDEKLRFTVVGEERFATLPSEQKQLLSRCVEEMVSFGAIGDQGSGSGGFSYMECGDVGEVAESVVPVFHVPSEAQIVCGAIAHEDSAVPVVSIDAEAEAVQEGSCLVCAASFRAGTHHFRASLARREDTGDFIFGVRRIDTAEDSEAMHLLHLCGRSGVSADCREEPRLGLFAEVHDVGGIRLLIIAFLDARPSALRVAVVDAATGDTFQLVAITEPWGNTNATTKMYPLAAQQKLATRETILSAYGMAYTGRPAVSVHPKARSVAGAALTASSLPERAPQLLRLLHRETRHLPSGQPVALSVVRELLSDDSVRFRVLMYHPVTAQETQLLLVNPLLDQALMACHLATSRDVAPEAIDLIGKKVASRILSLLHVHPDGQGMEFRGDGLPAESHRQP